jgi:hypothetical protein
MQLMEVLFAVTGLTGGITLAWLIRMVSRLFSHEPEATAQFGPGSGEALAQALAAARREVLFLSPEGPSGAAVQALAEAKARGASVEVVLGPGADSQPLSDAGIQPACSQAMPGRSTSAVLIDGRVLLVWDEPWGSGEAEAGGLMMTFKGQVALSAAFREQILSLRDRARPPVPAPAAIPVFTLPTALPDTRAAAPEPAPSAPAPTASDEVFSYSFNHTAPEAPAVPQAMPVASAPPPSPMLAAAAEEKADRPPASAAPATLAAADLFARLRREVAAARELEESEREKG